MNDNYIDTTLKMSSTLDTGRFQELFLRFFLRHEEAILAHHLN